MNPNYFVDGTGKTIALAGFHNVQRAGFWKYGRVRTFFCGSSRFFLFFAQRDALCAYVEAVEQAFGADVDFAQIVETYSDFGGCSSASGNRSGV
jgi:hypothetical protein